MNLKIETPVRSRVAFIALLVVFCLIWTRTGHTQESANQQDFTVLHYSARIDPNLSEKTLRGNETTRVALLKADVHHLAFDEGDLVIDEVSQNGKKLSFEKVEKRLSQR